jgi:hypothetical protein
MYINYAHYIGGDYQQKDLYYIKNTYMYIQYICYYLKLVVKCQSFLYFYIYLQGSQIIKIIIIIIEISFNIFLFIYIYKFNSFNFKSYSIVD